MQLVATGKHSFRHTVAAGHNDIVPRQIKLLDGKREQGQVFSIVVANLTPRLQYRTMNLPRLETKLTNGLG
jgi:hypothetical protein